MLTRVHLTISLIFLVSLSGLAPPVLAQGGAIVQHSAPRWQVAYWNNISLSGAPALEGQEDVLDHDWGSGSPDPSIHKDQFSARWTRYIDVAPDTYRFTATSDDGIRIWIDGDLLIDQWHDHAPTTYTAERYLGAGHHLVKVEYYENDGVAVARLSWAQVDDIQGWRGEYYNNRTLSGSPSLVRDDAKIDFSWGSASPAPGLVDSDVFSIRWTRNPDLRAGNYRFTMTVDDGARLYVNGHLLIDAWKDQPPHTYTGDIYLAGGVITVQMEYYESFGDATARLAWGDVSSPDWQTFSNPYFAITLEHPANWQPVPGYTDPRAGEKYAGSDGFFMITAMDGDSIDSVAASEAYHRLQPYGSTPTIEILQIDGQDARLILPSADASMGDQSALIVRYPVPVDITGHPCSYFMLYADQSHIRAIGGTMRFNERPAPSGTVVVDDSDGGFVRSGSVTGWRTAAEGHRGRLTWTWNNDQERANYNRARWNAGLVAGRYEVLVYIPERYSTTSKAHYRVSHRDGSTLQIVDQSANGDRWVSLGTYWFSGVYPQDYVSLSDVTYEPYVSRLVAFDAVKWVPR